MLLKSFFLLFKSLHSASRCCFLNLPPIFLASLTTHLLLLPFPSILEIDSVTNSLVYCLCCFLLSLLVSIIFPESSFLLICAKEERIMKYNCLTPLLVVIRIAFEGGQWWLIYLHISVILKSYLHISIMRWSFLLQTKIRCKAPDAFRNTKITILNGRWHFLLEK